MHPAWAQHLSHWPSEKKALLDRYAASLRKVNKSINLVSRKDIDNLEERHILNALAIYEAGLLKNISTLADIGTGGGLPGIPLAIAAPEVMVTLVDSIEKKVKVLGLIVSELALPNVQVVRARAEDFEGTFDLITGRAVCPLPEFLKLVCHLMAQGGVVAYLTGSKNPAERCIRGWEIQEIPIAAIFPTSEFLRDKFILLARRRE
jgi:16S rRNA (guanine527-N7)-methyltransferase